MSSGNIPGGVSGKKRRGKDISGKKAGRLVAQRPTGEYENKGYVWTWLCSCGRFVDLPTTHGRLSCGECTAMNPGPKGPRLSEKEAEKRALPEYSVWRGIRKRCNPKNKNKVAKHYVSRDIHVCDRWQNSFDNFLEDMGRRPSDKHTIERKDNDKGYSPDNCVWATRKEQARNRSNSIIITVGSVSKCLSEWADYHGIHRATLMSRYTRGARGMDLFKPVRRRASSITKETIE